jgi:hypothetical protein
LASEDDDDKKKKDEEAKRKAEEEDEEKKEAKRKAEDDDAAKKKAEEDDKKKKDEEAKKAKSKKADKEDGDDDDDDEKEPAAKAARARERSRIRAIVSCEAAGSFPRMAEHYALNTSIPRADAIAHLTARNLDAPAATAAPAPRRDDLRERMAAAPQPNVGGASPSPAPDLAAQIILAGRRRRGEV